MKKLASKHGSELDKRDDVYRFKISKKEWIIIGEKAGWMKEAQNIWGDSSDMPENEEFMNLVLLGDVSSLNEFVNNYDAIDVWDIIEGVEKAKEKGDQGMLKYLLRLYRDQWESADHHNHWEKMLRKIFDGENWREKL